MDLPKLKGEMQQSPKMINWKILESIKHRTDDYISTNIFKTQSISDILQ